MKMKRLVPALVVLASGMTGVARAEGWPAEWWQGKYATGEWFGVRETLEDRGFTPNVSWKGNFLGVVDGGLGQRGGFDEEFLFRPKLELDKALGVPELKGLSVSGWVRYRDGSGVNKSVRAGMFDPSTFQGGKWWRLQGFFLTYTTPELFGRKEFLTLSGGWQNATDFFINQPESKFFLNNTLTSSRGFSVNGIPWGGSFVSWGGYLRVKPADWFYAQAGLYMAYPESGSTGNHGLAFCGFGPDPSENGLFWLVESGFTPKIGPSKLPGRYAVGYLNYGVENLSYNGVAYDNRSAVYFQADQMLYREPSPDSGGASGKSVVVAEDGGKSFKSPVKTESPRLSEQGLRFFSLINVAPDYNSAVPFYFQTGLLYRGLVPTRDNDQLGVAIAYGNYSDDKIAADRRRGRAEQTYQAALEIDYRIQLTKFAYIQPSFQYIIRPGATGGIENATVLGAQFGATF